VAKGEADGKRSLIERFLSGSFPGEVFPQIEGLSQAEDLDRLFDAVIRAQTAESAGAAVQSALQHAVSE
jgi:hypothetical protein